MFELNEKKYRNQVRNRCNEIKAACAPLEADGSLLVGKWREDRINAESIEQLRLRGHIEVSAGFVYLPQGVQKALPL